MPKVFLSPAQHAKPCLVPGCDERKHNNLICDAMIPHLDASGIEWMRNDWAEERPAEIVKKSNAFRPDLHFTFHTNGGGGRRCTFYNSGSAKSVRFSQVLAKHYGVVYPHLIKPSDKYPPSVCREYWTELTATTAPAVYAEQWFHDNETDCAWGHANIDETAKSHVAAICEYLGVAFVEAGEQQPGPEPQPDPQPVSSYTTYTIQPGDTLWTLAKRYNTTVAVLAGLNGIADTSMIRAGQTISIPKDGEEQQPKLYTVQAGDTLTAIARKHGTTWDVLAKLNGLSNPGLIYPGQVLMIE